MTYTKADASRSAADGLVPVLRAGNLQKGRVVWDDLVFVPARFVSPDQRIRAGDIVVAMSSGSASVVGKASLVTAEDAARGAAFGAFCGLWRPVYPGRSGWISQFFQTRAYRQSVYDAAQGVNINNLRSGHIGGLQVAIPPPTAQREILRTLEALQARAARARSSLAAAQPLLEKLQQSLLGAAFRGELTRSWRAANKGVEPAATLLERLRIERRRKWEEIELAKMKERGKAPKDDRWRAKYSQPEAIDSSGMPILPDGWCWAALEELTFIVGGLTKGQKRAATETLRLVPYLRVANVQRGHLDLEEVKTIEATEKEIADLRLEDGDILLNEGGDRDKLGRGWVWSGELAECVHQNHVFRARPINDALNSRYLSHYSNLKGQSFFIDQGKQTTNLASVSLSRVRRFPVALPPLLEQAALVGLISERMAEVARVVSASISAEQQLVELQKVILDKAFDGSLLSHRYSPPTIFDEEARSQDENEQPTTDDDTQRREPPVSDEHEHLSERSNRVPDEISAGEAPGRKRKPTARVPTQGRCRLCESNAILQNSHILPRWVYREVANTGRSTGGGYYINVTSAGAHRAIKQARERLLCSSCELRLSVWEGLVKKLVIQEDGSFPLLEETLPFHAPVAAKGYAAATFLNEQTRLTLVKFCASIFWRAAVSTSIASFASFTLESSTADALRDYLLSDVLELPGELALPLEVPASANYARMRVVSEPHAGSETASSSFYLFGLFAHLYEHADAVLREGCLSRRNVLFLQDGTKAHAYIRHLPERALASGNTPKWTAAEIAWALPAFPEKDP